MLVSSMLQNMQFSSSRFAHILRLPNFSHFVTIESQSNKLIASCPLGFQNTLNPGITAQSLKKWCVF